MITACFARALQRCTSHLDTGFLLIFQTFKPIGKTRNQLYMTFFLLSTAKTVVPLGQRFFLSALNGGVSRNEE
jgi:hypothetical protein